MQHLAAGGEPEGLPGGGGKRYDEHGRLISENFDEFAAWAASAGLIPRSDLAA